MSAQREARSELICPAARVSTDTLSTRSHLLSVAVAPSTCFSRDRAPVPRLVSLSTPPGNSLHLEIYSRLSQLNGNHSQLYCSLNTAGDTHTVRTRQPSRGSSCLLARGAHAAPLATSLCSLCDRIETDAEKGMAVR